MKNDTTPYNRPPNRIPLKYHRDLGICKAHLVRINQGNKILTPAAAMQLEDMDPRFPVRDTRPDLIPLAPYLCPLFGYKKLCQNAKPCQDATPDKMNDGSKK